MYSYLCYHWYYFYSILLISAIFPRNQSILSPCHTFYSHHLNLTHSSRVSSPHPPSHSWILRKWSFLFCLAVTHNPLPSSCLLSYSNRIFSSCGNFSTNSPILFCIFLWILNYFSTAIVIRTNLSCNANFFMLIW